MSSPIIDVIAGQMWGAWMHDPEFLLRTPGGGIPGDIGILFLLDREQTVRHVINQRGCPDRWLEPIPERYHVAYDHDVTTPTMRTRVWRPTSAYAEANLDASVALRNGLQVPAGRYELRIVGCVYEVEA